MNNSKVKEYLLNLLDNSERNGTTEEDEIKIDEDNFPHYLQNKTYPLIQQEIKDICYIHDNDDKICSKLREYRYVDKICDLVRGKFVRWIRIPDGNDSASLTKGGIVTDIKFLENGIHVLIKNALNRFIQYKFDECITFQKFSVEELLFLKLL
jgi:hypothetical protein